MTLGIIRNVRNFSFGRADSLTPDVDSTVGTTTTGISLVILETPTTRTEVGGGAGGVEV